MSLRKKYNWRQDTPEQQLVVCLQSIEGWALNLEDGCTDGKTAAEYILHGVQQIKELTPFINKGSWGWREERAFDES